MKKGLFVTFEGGEGAGKSTLALRVRDALKAQGRNVLFTREPGGTPFGEELRTLLLHHQAKIIPEAELFLFLASRIQHLEELILPALNKGAIVLCDRFTDSTIAYQGEGRGLGVEYITTCCRLATKGFEPDLTFFVDLDPKIGLERTNVRTSTSHASCDRLEKESLAFHEKVRGGFLALAKQNPERIIMLNGLLEPEALFQEAMAHLQKKFIACPVQ